MPSTLGPHSLVPSEPTPIPVCDPTCTTPTQPSTPPPCHFQQLCLHRQGLCGWMVECLEVDDLGLEGNQNKLGPLEDLLEIATPMGLVGHETRYDPSLIGCPHIYIGMWGG